MRSATVATVHASPSHSSAGSLIGLQHFERISVSILFVPVYRMHQPTVVSPCLLGNLCPVCTLHQLCFSGRECQWCKRGQAFDCERASPAEPAFHLRFRTALSLMYDGLAKVVHRDSAIQLLFDHEQYLRDQSCNVAPHIVRMYAAGSLRARVAVDIGWGLRIESMLPQKRKVIIDDVKRRTALARQRRRYGHV